MVQQFVQNRKTGTTTSEWRTTREATTNATGGAGLVEQIAPTKQRTTTNDRGATADPTREGPASTPSVAEQSVQTRKPDATTDTTGGTSDVVEQTHQTKQRTRNAATNDRAEATDNTANLAEQIHHVTQTGATTNAATDATTNVTAR